VITDKPGFGKIFIRKMRVDYHVASSERRQDQMAAFLLGAPNEDAAQIDAVVFAGESHREQPELQYEFVSFYAGDRLIATKEVMRINDLHNMRAKRVYAAALPLHQKEPQTKKPGHLPGFFYLTSRSSTAGRFRRAALVKQAFGVYP
jgi:hypothetical protein